MNAPRPIRSASVVLCLWSLLAFGCTAEMKARGYAPADRDQWQQPKRVITELGLRPGMRVADIGSGGGYFSFALAEGVAPDGIVYAVDVDEAMNERLEMLAVERGVRNLRTVLAGSDDPGLPEPVDLVFTSNTYHHLPDQRAYFENLRQSLRPGARVAIIEYREEGFMQRVMGHATGSDIIRQQMEAAGYELVKEHDFLERQSFLVFRPR